MVTKEMIKSEIERVPDERLEELYGVIKSYIRDEPVDEERPRRFKAAADEVCGKRKIVFEELAKGVE